MTKNSRMPMTPGQDEVIVYDRSDARGRSRPGTSRPHGRRVVTSLQATSATAWDDFARRRQQRYAARTKAPSHSRLKPRTLAQTGVAAENGVARAIKPLPRRVATPVPARSGERTKRSWLLWRLIAFLSLVVILICSAEFVLNSPAFRVARVNVRGTHNDLLIQRIQQLGMLGQNIFLIDTTNLTARIEAMPVVASAALAKQWPNELTVMVTERTPTLVWQTSNGVFSVDNKGVVIAATSVTAEHLPMIVDARPCGGNGAQGRCQGQALQAGARLNAEDIAFAQAVFEEIPRLTSVTSFTLRYTNGEPAGSENGAFSVASAEGWTAYLGGVNDTNPLDNRLLELQQILVMAQQQQLHLAMIDLRFGLRPIYTLKN